MAIQEAVGVSLLGKLVQSVVKPDPLQLAEVLEDRSSTVARGLPLPSGLVQVPLHALHAAPHLRRVLSVQARQRTQNADNQPREGLQAIIVQAANAADECWNICSGGHCGQGAQPT